MENKATSKGVLLLNRFTAKNFEPPLGKLHLHVFLKSPVARLSSCTKLEHSQSPFSNLTLSQTLLQVNSAASE